MPRLAPLRRRLAPVYATVTALTLTMVLIVGGTPPVAAWTNGAGDGYETHDWIIDQALRVLDGKADDWFDRGTALRASDDPDHIEVRADQSRDVEHLYRESGRRGGAIHRITEHYAAAVRLYAEGAAARAAGDTATAAAKFTAASYNIGMLSHFYGDILQPFHSASAGGGKLAAHLAYEHLVGAKTRTRDASPGWQSTNRTVTTIANVRLAAIAAAAYSRARFGTLYRSFILDETVISPTVSRVTKEVLVRAADDLADVIWSISQGAGIAPDVATLAVSIRWHGTRQYETAETVYATAKDVHGKPIEGLQVDVLWPLPGGGTKRVRFWTDPAGAGHYTGSVGLSPLMRKRPVVVSATTNGKTVRSSTWFYETPQLAYATAGFRTTVSDRTVRAGQTVTVHTYARDVYGRPVAGLYVRWTWSLHGTLLWTSGYTNAYGRASSSMTVTSATTRYRIYVYARAAAHSINRVSSTWFARTD